MIKITHVGSCISLRIFEWYRHQRPWMTLNSQYALGFRICASSRLSGAHQENVHYCGITYRVLAIEQLYDSLDNVTCNTAKHAVRHMLALCQKTWLTLQFSRFQFSVHRRSSDPYISKFTWVNRMAGRINFDAKRTRFGYHRRGNDLSVWEAKIGENNQDNQIQSITFCNMYFFEKRIRNVQWGCPRRGEFSRIFVSKVTLQSIRLL